MVGCDFTSLRHVFFFFFVFGFLGFFLYKNHDGMRNKTIKVN